MCPKFCPMKVVWVAFSITVGTQPSIRNYYAPPAACITAVNHQGKTICPTTLPKKVFTDPTTMFELSLIYRQDWRENSTRTLWQKKNMIHFGDSPCRLVGAKAEKQWDYRAFFTSKDSLPKNWQASNLYLPCITSAAGSSNGLPKVPDFSEKAQAGRIPSCNFPMSKCRSAKAEHYTDEFLTCKIKGLVNVVKGPLCRHEVHALHPVPYLENPL